MGKELFSKPKRWVSKVFIHCSASDIKAHDNIQTIQNWHMQRGFNEIGYHYFINKEGLIFMGRDIEKIPAAQEGYNTGSIAICLSGLVKFTEAQFASLVSLCKAIRAELPYVSFHGHCEVSKKSCPNFDYKKVLAGLI